jgi:sarcosine oxidase subunit alpha
MTGAFRTPQGGRIDRTRALHFTFDGRQMQGFAGDTLASALLANGVHLVGRSFKYHRPRGIMTAGVEEPNALVTISRGAGRVTPNLRATEIELYDGLIATSQNRWPSLGFDLQALGGLASPFLGAGFYYRTFMGPRFAAKHGLWPRLFEPLIRRAAGLGRAPTEPDLDTYSNRFAHCEVLVIGAGEAGLTAALDASADAAARVMLVDEQAEPGGWLLNGDARLAGLLETLAARPNVRLMPRTRAFGYYAQNFIALAENLTDHLGALPEGAPRERLWQVRAGEIVLATGAIERPLVFPDNDRPGIMLASAAETYISRYGTRPGSRAVIFAGCDSAYGAAFALQRGGVEIAAILDPRDKLDPALAAETLAAGIPLHPATVVIGTAGSTRIREVHLGKVRPDGSVTPTDRIACDLLAVSGGWTPSVHLFSQSRGQLIWDSGRFAFLPGEAARGQNLRAIGACTGDFGPDMRGSAPGEIPLPGDPDRAKAFVDFQNDVTARDLRLATREGFRSVEHVKRYTTTGMATDQGKTSNLNALGIIAKDLGKSIPEVGLTTFRQPYAPVSFGLFAGAARGASFDPVRQTPVHAEAEAAGAIFEDVGTWKRAHYFPHPEENGQPEDMHAAVARECRMTRGSVGLFDASTLGKIELVGPDAAELLERLYVNTWKNLGIGRCRYGLMLNEAGYVIDDGVVARLAADRFHITTTTGGAARVFTLIEDYLQTEWPDLKVWQTSITEQFAVIAVQGPRARETLAPLVEGIDISTAAFPHMSIREGQVAGTPARLFRVSFTGEAGFEVNVPASEGARVWRALLAEAEKHGGGPYGTEAMHVMRAEKGYIIVGQETDGTVTPDDLGLGRMIGRAKPDFIGKRGLMRPDLVVAGRRQLVGLESTVVMEEGAQITSEPSPAPGSAALGHVTSAYMSATLDRPIALALVADGRARIGETLHVPMPSGTIAVRLVEPVFLDPTGERLEGESPEGRVQGTTADA